MRAHPSGHSAADRTNANRVFLRRIARSSTQLIRQDSEQWLRVRPPLLGLMRTNAKRRPIGLVSPQYVLGMRKRYSGELVDTIPFSESACRGECVGARPSRHCAGDSRALAIRGATLADGRALDTTRAYAEGDGWTVKGRGSIGRKAMRHRQDLAERRHLLSLVDCGPLAFV